MGAPPKRQNGVGMGIPEIVHRKWAASEQDDVRADIDQAQWNGLGFFIQNFFSFGVFPSK